MPQRRDNFTKTTIRNLMLRAGNQCSNPKCPKPTSGPSKNDEQKGFSIGVAAHISGAAPNGPRYNPSLTSSQRRDISNAIWLCENCSVMIDKDETSYSQELLIEWKYCHEQIIASQNCGDLTNRHRLMEIEVENISGIAGKVSARLGLCTVFLRTDRLNRSITHFLDAFGNKRQLHWLMKSQEREPSKVKVNILKDKVTKYSYVIRNNVSSFFVNGRRNPMSTLPFKTVCILDEYFREMENRSISTVAKYFNTEVTRISNLFGSHTELDYLYVHDIIVSHDMIHIKLKENEPYRAMDSISGGELKMVLLEIAVRIAHFLSHDQDVLFLVNIAALSPLDDKRVIQLLHFLDDKERGFQSVLDLYNLPQGLDTKRTIFYCANGGNLSVNEFKLQATM